MCLCQLFASKVKRANGIQRKQTKKCSSSAEEDEINKVENNSSTEFKDFEIQIDSKYDIAKQYSQGPSDRIVCNVDHLLYKVNPAAYKAKIVIIGPLRRYDTIFPFEIQKRIYLKSFLQRPGMKASLNDFYERIKKSAPRIHGCYEETYVRTWDSRSHEIQQNQQAKDGSSNFFIDMVLVDATFIIELFLRAYHDQKIGRHESDILRQDLFLVHNQLPFFILKDLYELAFGGNSDPSFLDLTCRFFSPYYNQNIFIDDEYRAKLEDSKHFTDFLRTLLCPYSFQKDSSKESPKADEARGEYLYSAVLLHKAGVKFKVNTGRCLLDIKFDRRNGEFRIPPLKVDESTEPFFRNLIAWEQRYYSDTYISDYIFLMEYLIKSTEDVDLLVRRRILINQLGSNTAVVTLFNNFCKNVPEVEKNRYSDIYRKLNAYNAVRHHGWIAILRLQYFSTLWRGVATIAAVVLIVLTLIQTICAVISL